LFQLPDLGSVYAPWPRFVPEFCWSWRSAGCGGHILIGG
jgi:hypothetical protein